MIDGLVAKRYAEALFEVANVKNLLDQVENDLQLIVQVINDTEDFMSFLRHPQIDGDVKKKMVESAFGDAISEISKNFFFQLIDSRREEFIQEILIQYRKLANSARGIMDIEATTVVSLDANDSEKIAKSFGDKLGKKIRLNNIVDPSIVGGMVIKIGDRKYDGSIKKQLQVMKRSLMASRV